MQHEQLKTQLQVTAYQFEAAAYAKQNGFLKEEYFCTIIVYSICHVTEHNDIHNFVFTKYYLGNKSDIDEKRNEL